MTQDIKYIKGASVYLISRPTVDWSQIIDLLADEGLPPVSDSIRSIDDPDAIIETAARVCYMSYGRGRKDIADFIHNLLSKGDGSVFEHVNYGVMITGVSRSLTHELVRHRAGFAYSQRSQRFVDESNAAFVIPPAIQDASAATQYAFVLATEQAQHEYNGLVQELTKDADNIDFETATDRRKAIRQAARSVLPNATETKIMVTANVRAWRHFLQQRGAATADLEIRRLAIKIWNLLHQEAPLLFGDFEIDMLPDGSATLAPRYHKI